MKYSLRWLNEFVDVEEFLQKPEELADRLTHAGLEVESVENLAEQLKHVVVGQIREKGIHPQADRLTLCQVDVGSGKVAQIVCGAQNHKSMDKVVVALPGAVLPGDFAIKLSKIRGIESQGMMCSEKELGLAKESEGILILDAESPVGKPFAEHWGLDDVILDVFITANRPDVLSHLGLARELACLLNKKLRAPKVKFRAGGFSSRELMSVKLQAAAECPRYSGRSLRGVKVGPSPLWMKRRLESLGHKSINNVVDVTNYVMLEVGQPLHAFDASQIQGRTLVIEKACQGERFQTLDGTSLTLTSEDLTIRDSKGAVALAGVVGGKNSGVSSETSEVFLESAHFRPESVRKTSRRLGIETDSSYLFSRGTDPEAVVAALNRASDLLVEFCGAEAAKDFHDHHPKPLKARKIEIQKEYLGQRLGYEVNFKSFISWMKRLGAESMKSDSARATFEIPLHRWDLESDIDLVEEFARLSGMDLVPESLPPLEVAPTFHDSRYEVQSHMIQWLVAEGYLQAINHHFLSEGFQKRFMGETSLLKSLGLEVEPKPVGLQNPLSEELGVMRTSLLPGLFQNVVHNFRYGCDYGRLFELGLVFGRRDEAYRESGCLALTQWGRYPGLWKESHPPVFDLKSGVENLLKRLQIGTWRWEQVEKPPEFLHPGQCAALFCEGRRVGFVGTLHPAWSDEMKLRGDVALGEFDLEKLLRGQPRLPKVRSISKFPFVERDFAFLVPDELGADLLVQEIRKVGGASLQAANVFDVYKDDKLPEGHRSLAIRLLYQDIEGTLDEKRLQEIQKSIIEAVTKKFSVQLRA